MKWHIGQKVICVKSHSYSDHNGVKKGKIFTIKGIRKGCCSIELDLGIVTPDWANLVQCMTCNKYFMVEPCWWMRDKLFAPLQTEDELSELTVEEMLEEEVTV